MTAPGTSLPYPPEELRRLVGPTDVAAFDNPTGALVLPGVPVEAYEAVFDFGCGCGRIARQLLQQRPPPRTYLGIDVHAGMIRWCQTHLLPLASGFRFEHHDVFARGLNPHGKQTWAPFPAADASRTLVVAWSVFTHLLEAQARYYLGEAARVLRADGRFLSTWFLFDKTGFPMMQEFQNVLYINDVDPTNAVIFDRRWLTATAASAGLKVIAATPPAIRGFQWILHMVHQGHSAPAVELPEDHAPAGIARPPLMPPNAEKLGL